MTWLWISHILGHREEGDISSNIIVVFKSYIIHKKVKMWLTMRNGINYKSFAKYHQIPINSKILSYICYNIIYLIQYLFVCKCFKTSVTSHANIHPCSRFIASIHSYDKSWVISTLVFTESMIQGYIYRVRFKT